MSINHILTYGWSGQNGQTPLSQTVTTTGQAETNLSVSIAGNTTNEQLALAWTNSKLQEISIYSDQTLTLKTNSSSVPQDTITVTASKPFVWYAGCGITNPFASDVTTTYWTNGGATAANLSVRTLVTS